MQRCTILLIIVCALTFFSCTTKSEDNGCKVKYERWARDSAHLKPVFNEKFSVHLMDDPSIQDSAILIPVDSIPWQPREFSLKSYCQKYILNYRHDDQYVAYYGMDSVKANDHWVQQDCDSIPTNRIGGHLLLFDSGIYMEWPVSGDCEQEFSTEDFKPPTDGGDDD